MIRQAYTMKLKPGFAAEYKKRHDEIWPELQKELRAAGVSDFSIFLDEKNLTLFIFGGEARLELHRVGLTDHIFKPLIFANLF